MRPPVVTCAGPARPGGMPGQLPLNVSARRRGDGGAHSFSRWVEIVAPCSPAATHSLCAAYKAAGSVKPTHADKRSVTRTVADDAPHCGPMQAAKRRTFGQAKHRASCDGAFMRSVTAESYHRRLVRALESIAGRLERPCTVEEVAAEAAFSRFHCQRMFRAMTGESIADLTRRLRLERAAWRLRHESVDVTEVALDAGYNSGEAFSRAFRRGCGMSPSQYRTTWPPPKFGSPMSRVRYYPGEERVEVDLPSGEINMEIRIETIDEIEVARVRHIGPYNEVGRCFERLFEWATSVGGRPGRVLSLSYDDPDTIAPESLRSDACLEIRTDVPPPPDITVDTLAGGRFAIYTHRGPYDGIPEAYRRLFSLWLPQSGEEADDRPCMEIYRNTPLDTPPAELLTDLCLPLRTTPEA